MWRPTLIIVVCCLVASLALACGDNGGSQSPTDTPSEGTTPIPTTIRGENEDGQAPVFWRAADNLDSLVVNESYKILFRITNGYAADSLVIDAVQQDGPGNLTITSHRAEPEGEDLPGSYYPTFLQFPDTGTWELTVHAGDDTATLSVEVKAASSSTRY